MTRALPLHIDLRLAAHIHNLEREECALLRHAIIGKRAAN